MEKRAGRAVKGRPGPAGTEGEPSTFARAVWVILGGALVLLALVLLARFILKPSAWRAELDHYLQYKGGGLAVVSSQQATRPEALTPERSGPTYGSGSDFATDTSYRQVQATRPLPYPPEEVWCVALRPAGGQTSTDEAAVEETLVFIARHRDGYGAGWVTHEATGDAQASWQEIGCR